MPSVTHFGSPTFAVGKKRTRQDEGEAQSPLYEIPPTRCFMRASTHHFHAHSNSTSNRDAFTTNGLPSINNYDRLVFHQASPNRGTPSSLLNIQRNISPTPIKRVRVSDENDDKELLTENGYSHGHPRIIQQHFHSHSHPDYSTPPMSPLIYPHLTRPALTRNHAMASLDPCHICHRKPTKKQDLDSFADCMGCGQRTCFVCIRQCHGWLPASSDNSIHQETIDGSVGDQDLSASFTMHDVNEVEEMARQDQRHSNSGGPGGKGWGAIGHCSMICSRCCVERGSEGDVVCLGCLAVMEGV